MPGKVQKIVAVCFLTLLVWAWAFLSLEESTTVFGSLELSPAASPEWYVTFRTEKKTDVDQVGLKLTFVGAPKESRDLERRHRAPDSDPTRERLDFYYDPAEYGHTEPGTYRINTLELVKAAHKMRDLALTAASCEPENIEVHIQKLELRELNVEIFDETGAAVAFESIEPSRVSMYVWENYTDTARIILTDQQIATARLRPIVERPFVILGPTEKRLYAEQTAKITLPSTILLKDQPPMQRPRIGVIWPTEMLGTCYTVELLNETDFRTINIKATDEAMAAYEQRPYQILIQVLEGDQNLEQIPLRPVIYNFPPDMSGQIQAPEPPHQAQIRLVPVTPAAPSPAAP